MDGRWIPAQAVIGEPNWLALEPSSGPSDGGGGGGGGLVQAVRKRGAAVLQARKLSSAMSAANATAAHLADWLGKSRVWPGSVAGYGLLVLDRLCRLFLRS